MSNATPRLLALLLFILSSESFGCWAASPVRFVARDGAIHAIKEGVDEKLFVYAMNLGVGLPGTQPGELAPTRDHYDRWFARMRRMGFTAIRIYTLHYPRFYEAVRDHNLRCPETPIYILHGVWLDEENPDMNRPDLHNLTPIFEQGIREAVGAVHGDIEISHRYGRAYGSYTADISPWVMGWIIGREIYPDEVEFTNLGHPEDNAYEGTHLTLPEGTPTEVWITERLDSLARYEDTNYGQQRPISASSWPTLDPLTHPTENTYSYEDSHWFDLANLDTSRFAPGYFASFHAYPYYPDFMSEQPEYLVETDSTGPNSYLGYLKELRNHYYPKPLFIAEFGVPSSWGNAHVAQSGMHHGGHDEIAQGRYAVRMFENMAEAGCAGGALFAWMDEWWKNTWITEFIDFPLPSRPVWLNVTAAEQNFGILSFDEDPPTLVPSAMEGQPGPITEVRWATTHRFFHLEIETDTTQWPLVIGLDTYGDDVGETILPDGTVTTNRSELALVLDGNRAELLVTEPYDLFGIWHDRWNYIQNEAQLYHSMPTDGAPWVPVRWLSNRRHASDDGTYAFPETIDPIGLLQVSEGDDFISSKDAVAIGENVIKIRIPWTLLQFTDPTQSIVMDDDRSTPERELAVSEGIRLVLSQGDGSVASDRHTWDSWSVPPKTTEREKAGVPIIQKHLIAAGGDEEMRLRVIYHVPPRITFDWFGGGRLEHGPTVNGPWSPIGNGAPTDFIISSSDRQFFRARR